MKIIIDLSFSLHGGSKSHAYGFLDFFQNSKEIDKVIIFSSFVNKPALQKYEKHAKIKIIFVKFLPPLIVFRLLWQQFVLPFHILKHGECWLFSPGNISPFVKLNLLSQVVVWVATVGPFCDEIFSKLGFRRKVVFYVNRMFMWVSILTADRVIHESDFSHRLLSNIGDERKHFTILAGKPDILARPGKFWLNQNGPIILVSHLYPYKYIEFVIQQFSLSCKALGGVELHIYGSFPDLKYKQTLLKTISEYKVEDRVHLKGSIPFGELIDVYVSCRFMIFSSLCESSGYALIEALSLGVPILASDRTAVPFTCAEGVCYFSYEDNSLSDSLNTWVNSSGVCADWSRRAYQRSRQLPSYRQAGKSFINVLNESL